MSINMESLNYADFKNLCRTCMFNCDAKFTPNNVILDVFYKLTDIHFETNDDLPQQICQKCFEKINEIQEFASRCKRTHSMLTDGLIILKNKRLNKILALDDNVIVCEHVNNSVQKEALNFTKEELEIKQEEIHFELNENKYIISSEDDVDKSDISNEEESINIDLNETKLKCSQCSKTFNQLNHLKNHMRMHTGERPNKKDEFEKVFINEENSTDPDRPHKCKECFRSFAHPSKLEVHMRTHSGERPYQCVMCSKSFNVLSNFKRHQKLHTNHNSYKCSTCDKTFNLASSLKRHQLIHSGKRPYKCSQCSKAFNQSANLTNHIRTHQRKHRYVCPFCEHTYTDLNMLRKHKRTHTQESI